jgi:hypothetical protein
MLPVSKLTATCRRVSHLTRPGRYRPPVVVTGWDDRTGCGYVVSTGRDIAEAGPGTREVSHGGRTVKATPELAAALRDALEHRPTARLSWAGPEVALTLEDVPLLGWLRHTVGGVLAVRGEPARPS